MRNDLQTAMLLLLAISGTGCIQKKSASEALQTVPPPNFDNAALCALPAAPSATALEALPDRFYKDDELFTMHLTMAPQDWETMRH